jgi:uncharacterized membrane-anchored protein
MDTSTSAPALRALSKVPEITAMFWVVKVLTTGMGETASDFLFQNLPPLPALAIGLIGLVTALILQRRARGYVVWRYWLAVSMVAVFGTQAADVAHVGLGVPYIASTLFFLVLLGVIFLAWQLTEHTLSIHSITTRRREWFYWATVMATFALGTAAGDLTAKTMHLGYLTSAIMFAVLIAIPAIAHRRARLNSIATFWFAYIVTRPLGASASDYFALSRHAGGLGAGAGPITLTLIAAIVVAMAFLGREAGEER